jgi:hypothetical protein
MEGMKFQNKSEEDLEYEMKIVTAIRNIINKNFRLQKCNNFFLKVQETQLRMALQNWTQGKHANV